MNRISLLLVPGVFAPVAMLAQTQAEVANYQVAYQRALVVDQIMQSAGGGIVVNPLLRPDPGKPFSATVTESTSQTLTDGTHVVRTTTTVEYRDADGRTRVDTMGPPTEFERKLGQIGQVQRVVIRDLIAGATYNLDPASKMAIRTPRIAAAPGAVYEPRETAGGRGGGGGGVGFGNDATAGGRRGGGGGGAGGRGGFMASVNSDSQAGNNPNNLVEDLGTLSVNGVSARGTRITNTVPVGAIGNDREFRSVTERWFSPELNLLIKSSSTDPRFGATTYELTNITRTPPDPSLFRLPADYTLR